MTQQDPKRPLGRGKKCTDWEEWPAILARLEELVASGMDGRDARLLTAKEFELHYDTLLRAVRRGDVPCIAAPDKARVEANLRGDIHYQGAPCDKCGGRERWVCDGICRACMAAYDREYSARKKQQATA